jgi:hypothetical protein
MRRPGAGFGPTREAPWVGGRGGDCCRRSSLDPRGDCRGAFDPNTASVNGRHGTLGAAFTSPLVDAMISVQSSGE